MYSWTVVLIILALPVLALALIGFRYVTRGTPVRHVSGEGGHADLPAVTDHSFAATIELHGKADLVCGNRIELLLNGDEIYPRLFEDLRAARRSITLQMYYWQPGQLADEVSRILRERAAAGVKVLVLYDAIGAGKLPREYTDQLRKGGVRVSVFRPVHWWALDKAYNRSHIRVVVVDTTVGYTGGFGIDDKWMGDGRHDGQWRDTAARFTGPAVVQLQAAFAAGWAEATGELLAGELLLGDHESPEGGRGGIRASVAHAAPTIGSTSAERLLALSIAAARRTLYITNAYFVPDEDFVGMLADAARRGVDVRILTASEKSDVKLTHWAGRSRYEALLAAGVRVFEYQPTMIHAKTIVTDACWSSVGTMNFDNRSLAFNDESNLVILDDEMGRRMHEIFEDDLRLAREFTLDHFRRRPRSERIKERMARLVERAL